MSEAFEVRLGTHWVLIVHLDAGQLLAVDVASQTPARYSDDGGRSWTEPGEMALLGDPRSLDVSGAPMGDMGSSRPLGTHLLSVCRLSSGRLGGIYREQDEELRERYPYRLWNHLRYITSDDGGHTWTGGYEIGHPGEALECVNSLVELSTGRLVAPMNWFVSDYEHAEYAGEGDGHSFQGGYGTYQGRRMLVEGHGHTPEFGGSVVLYSDDQGRTWRSGPNNLWNWPLPSEQDFGGHSALYEPVVVELTDGRLRMFLRSQLGQLYQSLSEDGGEHWSVPGPTGLASSDSPCMVRRIPTTGDLLIVWNQMSADEILNGLKRARLTTAISRDDGETWGSVRTLEHTAVPEVGRIEPPPIRTYHSHDDVGEIPVDFGCFDYPNVAFVGDTVLFTHGVHEMRPMSEWSDGTPIHGERDMYGKLKALPVSWLYE